MLTTKELRDKRTKLAAEAREVLDAPAKDKRETLRAEEHEKFDVLHKEIEQLALHIKLRERQDEEERHLAEPQERKILPLESAGNGHAGSLPQTYRLRRGEEDSREALRAWLLAGSDRQMTQDQHEVAQRVGIDLRQKQLHLRLPRDPLTSVRMLPDWEQRAQAVATGGAGGFTVPDETMRALEVALLTFGGMRTVANIIRTSSGADLPIPATNDTAQKGAILAENTQVTQQDVVFTQLILQAYKYTSKMILVSVEFLQDSSVNVPAFLGEALGTRLGRITNEHFTTGTGTNQPNGIVTAAVSGKVGITGQTTSVIYDDLVDLVHSVDPAYRANGAFMFHDNTLRALKKIKIPQFTGDTQGMPLWQPGMVAGQPDSILGYRFVINQDMPVMAANARSILFGDFGKYIVRDVVDVTLVRLDERFADFHQVAFLAFSRHDGDLLNAGTNPIKYYANSAT
jgi:HK97 family phage major capsid protein